VNWTVTHADVGLRLDKYLADPARLGSRARAAAALDRRKIFLNGREATPADAAVKLSAGDAVRVWMDRPGTSRRAPRASKTTDLDIVFEDASIIVVNKPAGLLSVPLERKPDAPSAYDLVERHLRSSGKIRPRIVHRIDQDTSGLVVFTKDERAQASLKLQFKRREPERVYWAIVYGQPDPPAGTWRDHLVWDEKALIQKATHPRDPRATEAISDYRTLERFHDTSLIEVRLLSGRRNQIRLQARLRGHTLVGEKRYTYGPDALRTIQFERHALHARRLGFRHPVDGRPLTFEADPPPDFAALVERLRRE
jgi:23S rRNA pseudouridine1911/1915/1917 synthase